MTKGKKTKRQKSSGKKTNGSSHSGGNRDSESDGGAATRNASTTRPGAGVTKMSPAIT
jgi:hypothetical protein